MTTINPNTFITDVLQTVDQVIGTFVQTGFTNLVDNNHDLITLLMTFYIIGLGYRFMTHSLGMDLNTIAKHLTILISVYALLTQWSLFYLFFYNIFTNEPGVIIQTMVSSDPNLNLPASNVNEALNAVFNQGMQAAVTLFHQGGFTSSDGLRAFLFGFLVAAMTCVGCLIALALLIYAKMAMAVMLLVAPFFITFLLWSSTRELFNKWLQALFNYAFIPIMTCGILMLTLSVANVTLPGLEATANSSTPTFTGLIPYLCICLVSALLFKQVIPIAAALSGGLALEGLRAAIPIAHQALKASGLTTLAGHTKEGIHQVRAHFTQKRAEQKRRAAERVNKN